MEKQQCYILSHTHWDREWYESFQNYRCRLVRLMDDLLDLMEGDPAYPYFHMDGQTIMLEDYLAIRPENESRLRKLITEGRIIIGPWYVMPDEFNISGESLVRNLQKGHQICAEYGAKPMPNGYVTDIFGHNAQFPQILKGFGIESAVLFRGVGDYPKDAFCWEGSDGSQVTVFRLDRDRCYSNFYFSLRWPFEGREIDWEEFGERAAQLLERSSKAAVCKVLLWMDGVDHIDAEHNLPRMIAYLNERFKGIEVCQSTMAEFIEAFKAADPQLDTLCGPLYNIGFKGLNNIVLRNVLSSMVHLKQANAACETLLTRWAEPFDFFSENCMPAGTAVEGVRHAQPRSGFFNEAWKLLLMNHPHDSICGCSITPVHQDNEYRFRQVSQIAERMTGDALTCIAEQIDTSAYNGRRCFAVFNPGQTESVDVTHLKLDLAPEEWRNFKLFDAAGHEVPYQILDIGTAFTKPVAPLNQLIRFVPAQTVTLALKTALPAMGYCLLTAEFYPALTPGDGVYRVEHPEPTRYTGSMRVAPACWDNGPLLVDATGGGLRLTNKETGKVYSNLLTFEDCGDIGEGWNYVKPPLDSEVLGSNGQLSVLSDGPMSAVLQWVHTMTLPAKVTNGSRRNSEPKTLVLTTTAIVIKDNPRIEFKTEVTNQVEDHRLRVLFPTGFTAKHFYTQTPFDMQVWPVKKADWSSAKETETHVNPMQGSLYIADGDDCVELYSKGLYEVEAREQDCTLALTLFRAFPIEVEQPHSDMGRMLRSMTFEYAIRIGSRRAPADAARESATWQLGLRSVETGVHPGKAPASLSFVSIKAKTSLLAALTDERAAEHTATLRLYNPADSSDKATLQLVCAISAAEVVDFNGNKITGLPVEDNRFSVTLHPHQIVTVRIRF